MTLVEHRVPRSGALLHFWLAGPDHGPLVALSHGATMDHHMFDAQVPVLAEAGYRVLTWDLRGHGRSKPIGDGFWVPACADDLLFLLDRVGAREAVLVGQSLGSYVSQELGDHHPERVRALVVIGSTSLTMPLTPLERWGLRLSPLLFRLWPYGHLRRLVARSTAATPEARAYAYQAIGQVSREEFNVIWSGVANALREDDAHRIRQPLLLTHGEHDRTGVVAKRAAAWAAREPDCRYEVIPDASHNANQDNPAVFNRILLGFLDEVRRRDAR